MNRNWMYGEFFFFFTKKEEKKEIWWNKKLGQKQRCGNKKAPGSFEEDEPSSVCRAWCWGLVRPSKKAQMPGHFPLCRGLSTYPDFSCPIIKCLLTWRLSLYEACARARRIHAQSEGTPWPPHMSQSLWNSSSLLSRYCEPSPVAQCICQIYLL